MAIRLYAHHVEGVSYTRDTLATPFRPVDAADAPHGFGFRDELAVAGIERATTLAAADVACLPATWDAYDAPGPRRAVRDLIERAAAAGCDVAVWVTGDDDLDLPWANVIQFQAGFHRSRPARTRRRALPVMFSDLVRYVFDDQLDVVAKGERPTVGFCGQAAASPVEEAKRLLHKGLVRTQRLAGRSDVVPEPLASHVRLRHRVLDRLAADPRVTTDFVVRDRYRAGLTVDAGRNDERIAATMAFYDNIRRNHYTVCVRGGGNFSARLYETLCFGRVPIIIDTDGLLPWPDDPFWRELVVVPVHDLASLGDRVVAHHGAVDDAGWAARQHRARAFWLERLDRPGYLRHLAELLR